MRKIVSVVMASLIVISFLSMFPVVKSRTVVQAVSEAEWKTAYKNTLLEFMDTNRYGYDSTLYISMWDLFDLDSDGIPELFISEGYAIACRVYMYYYQDGKAVPVDSDSDGNPDMLGSMGTIAACKEEEIIESGYYDQGIESSVIYHYSNHKLTMIESFYNDEGACDNNATYELNDNKVTIEEYNKAVQDNQTRNWVGIGQRYEFDDFSSLAVEQADEVPSITLSVPQVTLYYQVAVPALPTVGDGDIWVITWDAVENADGYECSMEHIGLDNNISNYTKTTTDLYYAIAGSSPFKESVRVRAYKSLSNGDIIYSDWSVERTAYIAGMDYDRQKELDYSEDAWRKAYKEQLRAYQRCFERSLMYGLDDLDQNGIPELIISFGAEYGENSYTMHTYDGEMILLVCQYFTNEKYKDLLSGASVTGRSFELSNTQPIDNWIYKVYPEETVKSETSTSESNSNETDVEQSKLIKYHIDQMCRNGYGFVNSSSSELGNLMNFIENDSAALNYKTLEAISDIIGGEYNVDEDMFQQDLAVQSIFAEILCNKSVFLSMGDVFFDAANKQTDFLLEAINACQTLDDVQSITDTLNQTTNTYDLRGELNRILSMGDHTSPEFIQAKNTWLLNANNYVSETKLFKKLFSELDLIEYGIELTDLAINNLMDLYTYCQLTAGYNALDDYMKESFGCYLKVFLQKVNKYQYGGRSSWYNVRANAVFSSFCDYYEKIVDSSNDRYLSFISEMASKDLQTISTSAEAIIAEKLIIEYVIAKACPQLYAVLKGAKIALDVGLLVWDKVAQMGDRTFAREMCYNYMVFQDTIYTAMTNVKMQDSFAERLNTEKDDESLILYEYGFQLYKAIYANTLKYGKQYYEYCSVVRQDILGQPNDNWVYAEYAKIFALKIEDLNNMRCHEANMDDIYRATGDLYNSCASYYIACPVNVHVLHDGKEVALLSENGIEKLEDEKVLADVLVDSEHPYAYKFLIVPDGYEVEIEGFAEGTMDFGKVMIENNVKVGVSHSENIAVQENTIIREIVKNGITNALSVDYDGDGKADKTIKLICEYDGEKSTSEKNYMKYLIVISVIATITLIFIFIVHRKKAIKQQMFY